MGGRIWCHTKVKSLIEKPQAVAKNGFRENRSAAHLEVREHRKHGERRFAAQHQAFQQSRLRVASLPILWQIARLMFAVCCRSSGVEHVLGKDGVGGSIPLGSTIKGGRPNRLASLNGFGGMNRRGRRFTTSHALACGARARRTVDIKVMA